MTSKNIVVLPTLESALATHAYHRYPYSDAFEIEMSNPSEKLLIWENPLTSELAGRLSTIGGTVKLNPIELKELLDDAARGRELIAA